MKSFWKMVGVGICGTLLTVALLPRRADAEHFDMVLRVQSAQGTGEAFMDTSPPLGGNNPRAVVKAKVGEKVKVVWQLKSGFPHGVMKGVTIHFFVVRQEKLGQKPVPNPAGPAGIVDNSFVMDFAPKATASGNLRMTFSEPGNYLVRVQSEDTHQEHDHEHFSAVDVQVQ